ncbi:MAG: ATP-dependent RecD-like DNA helicase [Chloroflexales bacterium]|nr:ATP-dependent RecD-like DNA helicase [Chloroflexales bacterium]
MNTLEGTLERITFHSDDGYTVARLTPRDKSYIVTVVGKLLGVSPGETLALEGRWVDHSAHGRQFEISSFRTLMPATIDGIRRYLGSGLIKGVGPVMAKRIADTFGKYTLDVIEREPDRLADVPGLGRKRVELIKAAWREQQKIKELMLTLQELGLSPGIAVRIYKQYGDDALRIVRHEPYRLADEVYGIGFLTADRIAQGLGVAHDDPQRIGAGLRFTLSEASNDGHCFLPEPELLGRAAALLQVSAEQTAAALHNPLVAGDILIENVELKIKKERSSAPSIDIGATLPVSAQPGSEFAEHSPDPSQFSILNSQFGAAVYLAPFAHAETGVAAGLSRLLYAPSAIAPFYHSVRWDQVFAHLNQRDGIPLTERQQHAARVALTSKVSVLTGGPGTGKTHLTRTIIRLLKARGYRYCLASPTGRAAKRLSEATGAEAKTIHRLLEFSPQGGAHFKRNADRPLECDLLIVDEVSMLDVLLANHLLKAIPPSAHLLLVGDADQLPSVGPGRVLRDLIESGSVPSVHLDAIFRQQEGSDIIANAHRINSGASPVFAGGTGGDFFFFVAPQPERCAELTVELVADRIPRRFGFDPLRDVQVLSPTHRGPAGVANLNALLQQALNPPRIGTAEKQYGAALFRIGDRVMQMRNNYDLDVYNGDIGVVTAIDVADQLLTVRYDERDVPYDFAILDELTLAYAISVHKSQGAEYPVVVVPLLMQHYNMLQRNLLYTGVTRARQLVVLVGDRRAIIRSVENNQVVERYTGLKQRLRAER